MTTASGSEVGAVPAPTTLRGVLPLQIAVAFFVVLRLMYAVAAPPNGDEAYYFLWGGHLQLSYYDHSPMVGWASALGRLVFGWTPAGLHFPALITFAVLVYALRRAAPRLAPEAPEQYFWLVLAVFCASPLFNALTILNYPDHLLICFGALALLELGKYLNDALEGAERPVDLYLGAALLGLAGLSKYNAVFIPAGLIIAVIAVPRLRRLLASPHLYLAGLLCFAIVSPVLIWNLENHLATLELHAVERLDSETSELAPMQLLRVVLTSILFVSPFLAVAFGRFLAGRPPVARQGGLLLLLRGTTIASTLFLLPLAAWGGIGRQVAPHWLVLSFLPLMLVTPFYLRSRILIGLHLGWGVLVNTLLVAYFLSAPLFTDMLGVGDGEAKRHYGQDQLGAAVAAAASEHGADLILTGNYTTAAKLAFGMGTDANISDNGGRIDLLVGRDRAADAGKTVLLVNPASSAAEHFDTLVALPKVTLTRFGHVLSTYDLQVGHGYEP